MYKKLFTLMIAFTFLLLSIPVSFAQSPTGITVKWLCPSGWEPIPGKTMTCKPKSPKSITQPCPKGYEYFEALSCTLYANTCSGCEVGCRKPPPR